MSLYTESVFTDTPFAYWPFQETEDAPTAVDVVGGLSAPYNAYVRPGGEGPLACMRGADFIDIADTIVDPNFNSYVITTSDNNADAHLINDGNPLTYWDSGVNQYAGMWVQVVFPTLVDVSNFSFALPEPIGFVYDYSVAISTDGVTFTNLGSGWSMTEESITYNGLGTAGEGEPISEDNGFRPAAIKGIRFTIINVFSGINSTRHWKIGEFKVYYNNLQNNMPYEWALQITDPSSFPVVGVTSFTSEFWMKPRWFSDTVPYEGRFFNIFAFWDAAFSYGTSLDIFQKRWGLDRTRTNNFRWAIPTLYVGGDGTRANADYDPDWELGFQWHHIVIMEDSIANIAQLFVDGVLVRTSIIPGQFFYDSGLFGSPAPIGTVMNHGLIGSYGFGPASDFGYTTDPYDNEDREERYFGGLAHLALYTHTLSPARVAAHFLAMKCGGVFTQGHVVS